MSKFSEFRKEVRGKLPDKIDFRLRLSWCKIITEIFSITKNRAAECLRCRLRSRAVKRAYFTLISTAMHAHPVRRRTAPVSYVRRHAPYGALYGYCIKIYKFFFLSNFAAPNAKFMPRRVDKMFGLQSERNGVSDNANRLRRHAGG